MRLSGYLMNKGLKPLTEQRMIELALAATFNKDFDLETTYAKLKKRARPSLGTLTLIQIKV